MHRLVLPLLSLFFLLSCTDSKNSKELKQTAKQKAEIESFSNRLINSINNFDFSVINNSWNNEAFKERVSNISLTEKSLFDHIFEKDLKRKIKVGNLTIIHQVNSDHGQVNFLKLNHIDDHSELILLLSFKNRYDFFKYRIEIIKGKPAITDFYSFKDNLWYSEKIVNILKLNSKYDAYSEERHQANRALSNSEQFLSHGDTLSSLYALYDIPESHEIGNGISIMRLNLASSLGDSIYASVLMNEHEYNKSLYMKYLYRLYFDSANLNSVYELLASELGDSKALDTLVKSDRFWN